MMRYGKMSGIFTLFVSFTLISAAFCAADSPALSALRLEAAISFEVAPNGSDENPGTPEKPFATFQRAVAAAREAQKNQASSDASADAKPIVVTFQAGEYRLAGPVALEGLHGTADAPILFRSAPGAKGKVIFNGGQRISGWKKLAESDAWPSDDAAYAKRIRPEARDQIYVADLAPLGVGDFGDATVYGKRPEIFCDSAPQRLARWPNEGFAQAGKACGTTERKSWGPTGFAEGIFEYAADQPLTWNDEPDAALFGYWFWDWAESFARLDRIDPETKTIHLKEPYHNYGYKHGLRYYGFNMLSELDAPGEYYIDSAKKLAFWIPPSGVDPNGALVSLTCYTDAVMLNIKNCDHVILAGLSFAEGRENAIAVTDCRETLLADLTIERFGRDAIHISGGTHCGVYNCLMQTLGCGGVLLSGGDRRELVAANHYLENSTVRDFSRIKRTYAPAVQLGGCGLHVAHCRFSGSSSSAISIGANDALIEYNRFDELVRESDDQGGIDIWYNPSLRGNVVRYNWWENIVGGTECGAAGIRLDDMISGFHIYGNVFVHCGAVQFGAIQIHGGKDNTINDNVFINCHAAVSFSSWGNRYLEEIKGGGHGGEMVMKRIYEDVDIRSEKWQKRYPELAHIEENPDANTVEKNLIVNGDEIFLRKVDAVKERENKRLSIENADPQKILTPEFLQENGVEPIPVEEIGPRPTAYLPD